MIPLIATEKEVFPLDEKCSAVLHPMDGEQEHKTIQLVEKYANSDEDEQFSNEIVDTFVCELQVGGKAVDLQGRKPSQVLRIAERARIVNHWMTIFSGMGDEDKKK